MHPKKLEADSPHFGFNQSVQYEFMKFKFSRRAFLSEFFTEDQSSFFGIQRTVQVFDKIPCHF